MACNCGGPNCPERHGITLRPLAPGCNKCKAEEWQRDGRGLWARRACNDLASHGGRHSFGLWEHNQQPPSGEIERDLLAALNDMRCRIKAWRIDADAGEEAAVSLLMDFDADVQDAIAKGRRYIQSDNTGGNNPPTAKAEGK